ncbi:MAG: PmbA/TldA family metallopeptidase, partial [Hyphomicrobiales bacterium]
MNETDNNELLDIAQAALDRARRFGADAADVDVVDGRSVSATSRLGKIEDVSRAEGQDLSLRVFVGRSSAVVSTNDLSAGTLDNLAERAVAMARLAPADDYAGLAKAALLATSWPDLDLFNAAS